MRFGENKKRSIVSYILEKIEQNTPALSKHVAQVLNISQNTVHTYLKELQDAGVIERKMRGQYALVERQFSYCFSRSKGELDSDTYAYNVCLKEHIADLAPNVVHIWEYALSEMVNNVMDHSGAENMVVRVTQTALSTHVLIGDDGVGIFHKIRDHFRLASTDEAISELFKGKLTTDEQNHSGEGIFFTSKMMDRFVILSDGKIFATNKYENDRVFDFDQLPLSGTFVRMSLQNASRREAQEVFDQYSDTAGGFTKTVLPLKNIFDTAPVSRSQAKRICNRLDEFKEAVLDFTGLEWMGQGFAHQVFVVYRREHPGVQLIPIGMSDAVAAMYRHVTGE